MNDKTLNPTTLFGKNGAGTPSMCATLYNAPSNPPETGGKLGKAHDNW